MRQLYPVTAFKKAYFFIFRSGFIVLLCLSFGKGWGQTNPAAQALPYTQNFSSFTGSTTAYPAGFQGWTISGTLGTAYGTTPSGDKALAGGTNASGSAGIYDMVGKMGILSTSSSIVASALALNTSANSNIQVSYLAATQAQTNGARTDELGVQYRVGTSGVFTTITGSTYQNNPTSTINSGTASSNTSTINFTLPAACENQGVVQLRWIMRDVSGTGNRPSFSFTNINITGTASASPNISPSSSSLTGFTYQAGAGPSLPQNLTISASNLSPAAGNVTVTASTDYEVSLDNSTFSNTISIAYTGGSLTSAGPVYIRLKAGLAVNNYNETIGISNGTTTASVTVSGSVTTVPNYYWNGPTTTGTGPAGGGSGTWDNATTTNWISPTNDAVGNAIVWTSNTSNNAFFGGTAGTVTLPATTSFANKTIQASGYTFVSPATLTGNIVQNSGVTSIYLDATVNGNQTLSINGNFSGGTAINFGSGATGTNITKLNLGTGTTGTNYTWSTPIKVTGTGFASFATGGTGSAAISTYSGNITGNGSRLNLGATTGYTVTFSGVINNGAGDVRLAAGSNGGAGVVIFSNSGNIWNNTLLTNSSTGIEKMGISNALPTGTTLIFGELTNAGSGTSGTTGTSTVDLNGFNQTLAGLTNSTNNGGIITNSALSTTSILTINGSTSPAAFSGIIQNGNGTVALIRAGTGATTLSGANTYTGTTTISGGNLFINGSTTSGSAITVGSSGTLAGSGTAAGAVALSGIVSPGAAVSTTGKLSTGAFTFAAGSTYKFEVTNVSGTAGMATGWDLLTSTGTVAFPASNITVDLTSVGTTGFSSTTGYTWKILTGTSITGFNASNITIQKTNFTPAFTGTFSVIQNSNEIDIVYMPASIAISAPITGSPFCVSGTSGTPVSIQFTSTGTYSSGNTYTAQLSPNTSFASPVNIGSISSTLNTGTINATIPAGTVAGSTYRIRIVSSNPVVTGADNGMDFIIDQTIPPTITITQPTCATATGTITVTAPTGAGIKYSIDGTTYQTSVTFGGVAVGSYNVISQGSSGCTSTSTPATINVQPLTPVAPSLNVVQPTCVVSTGTITITAPTGSGLTYSIDGTSYQSGVTFNTVAPATYSVTVKNSSGCVSPATGVTINDPATYSTGTSIAPVGTQTIATSTNGSTLTVSEGTVTVLSRQWYYGTSSGGPYSNILSGETSTTYIPNFSTSGAYYIVCITSYGSPCNSTKTSNEVQIQVSNNMITTGSIASPTLCSGAVITVPFTYSLPSSFPTSTFTAQLSNAAGSFTAPVAIGTISSDGSGGQNVSATIPVATTAGTGYRIRVVSNTPVLNGTDNGSNITINTAVTITTPPSTATQTICSGDVLTALSVVATGTSPTYQWYINTTASNASGTAISGATTNSYTPSNTSAGVRYYYVIVGGQSPCGAATSTVSGAITVNSLPADPTGTIASSANPSCGPATLSYPAATSPLVNYWQTTATGIATTQSTATPYILGTSGTIYVRAQNATTGCFSTNSLSSGVIAVTPADTIVDPSNASIFAPATATFSVTATNATAYQWQVNDGTGFVNISGATSASYTTPATTVSMNNYKYQVIITGVSPCTSITSAAATLTVNTAASIWTNPITGTSPDPSVSNPFTSGDVTDPGLTVSGITRSAALSPNAGTNRYNATNWPLTSTIDATKYFLFTLTPNAGYHINFLNFVYTGQHSPTGTQNFSIRSSLDGFASDISTLSSPNGSGSVNIGATVNLATAAFQNITSAITFRFYAWNATSTSGTFSINDFTFNGSVDPNCTPTKLIFSNTIANPSQDVVIPTFKVSIACASNTVITSCSNGTITLTSTGCGLKGTLTKPVVNGVATFDDISFDRSTQTALSFTGTYAGTCGAYTPAVSNNFDVTFTGAGIPVVTILKNENFDGSTPAWAYGIGTASLTNAGAPGGADVTGPKNFGAPNNNSISKSYSQDNSSGKQGSTNTITFNNVTGLAIYNSVKFSFQVGSLPVGTTGTGAGADNGEYMYIETSIDGGATWKKTLTNNGLGDHAFNLSATSPVSLAYDANAIYSSGNSLWFQSAFTITLPPGTDQFMFRMTANNNRTNENWVLDNLLLQGTTNGTGTQKPLPVATAYDIMACPGSSNTISFSVANGAGTLTYLWTPNTSISSTTINNPVVNPMATITYTGVASDTDKCTTSANVTVTVPSGAAGTWTGTASKDYFNCLNWANGVVPTATTDVTVTSTTNTVEMDATSPFAAAFSSTGTVNNISITSNNINFITGTEKLTIGGNLSLNSGSNINMTNGGLVNIAGNWDNSGGGNLTGGTGTVNYNGAAQNIGLETYHHLTLSGSGIKTAPAGILIVQGDLVRSGSASFNANGGTVLLNGITQSFSGLSFNNLALTNGTKSTAGSSTITDSVKLNDATALSITAGDSITLLSTSAKTARIGQIGTGTINYNTTGRFVIERYIPSRKAWRFLAVPDTSTQTVKQQWQEGAANSAANPKPHYGTQITSDRPTWAADGFDNFSVNGPSMKSYVSSTDTYLGIASTNVAFSPSLGGYMTFIRGDRTATGFSSPITNTVLRTTGLLYTGDRPVINVVTNKFTPVSNPYASTIALNKISTGIFYYVWDPNRGGNFGYGAFYSLSWNGTDFDVIPAGAGGSYGLKTNFIESSQAFFTSTLGPTVPITLTENAKTFAATEPSPFRVHSTTSKLWINLFKADSVANILADGILNDFSNDYPKNTNDYDGLKLSNFTENLSIVSNNKLLVVKKSPLLTANDTIFLHLTGISNRGYIMEFYPENLGHTGLSAYLEDKYLQNKTAVSLTDTTRINFVVNSDQLSMAADRFNIVFDVAERPLPVTITTVKANRQNAFIKVQWNVQNESNVKQYIVEKSADGSLFSPIGSVPAINAATNNYTLADEHPFSGINYYRIKIIDINGAISYSTIVKVMITIEAPRITIYPNPITDSQIHLQFVNEPAGKYGIRLLNKLGQLMTEKQVTREEGNSTEFIKWDFTAAHGLYQLEVTQPDGMVKNMNVLY